MENKKEHSVYHTALGKFGEGSQDNPTRSLSPDYASQFLAYH